MDSRRQFLRTTVLGVTAAASSAAAPKSVTIVLDPSDPVAAAPPSRWAARELSTSLSDRGVPARTVDRIAQADAADLCVVAARSRQGSGPSVPESLSLSESKLGGRDVLLANGHDARVRRFFIAMHARGHVRSMQAPARASKSDQLPASEDSC